MNYQETHVKKASQIIHLRKKWPVPIHTGKKPPKTYLEYYVVLLHSLKANKRWL